MLHSSIRAASFRRLLIAVLLIVPLAGLGVKPNAQFPEAPQAQVNPEEKFNLRFSPPPGQTLVYNLQTRMDSEGEGFLGKSLTLSAQADGEISVFVRQVARDSVFADLSSPGIRIFLQSPGRQNEFTLKNSPDSPVRVTFDRTGRIRDIRNVETLEKQNPLNFSILEVLRNYWPSFPERSLSLGESWPDHKRFVVPFQGMNLTIELEINFTLNSVVPSPNGRLAFITAAYTATLSGDRQVEDYRGSFEGSGTGTGSLNFQIDSGTFSEYRLDYVINGAMVMRKAESEVAQWPFQLTANAGLLLLEWR